MITKSALLNVFFTVCFCISLPGQQIPAPAPAATPLEFPLILQQTVLAGKTTVGTKIEARLSLATLVDGKVIPRNALFSGEVMESAAKSKSAPSRLAIRFESAQWKNMSASMKIYLLPWFYPSVASQSSQDLQYGPPQPPSRTWNGQGEYPDTNTKVYRPFPGADSDKDSAVPNASVSATSNQRLQLKNVTSELGSDGTITLVSSHSNIKLDKSTTYLVGTGEVTPPSSKK